MDSGQRFLWRGLYITYVGLNDLWDRFNFPGAGMVLRSLIASNKKKSALGNESTNSLDYRPTNLSPEPRDGMCKRQALQRVQCEATWSAFRVWIIWWKIVYPRRLHATTWLKRLRIDWAKRRMLSIHARIDVRMSATICGNLNILSKCRQQIIRERFLCIYDIVYKVYMYSCW